MSSEPERDVPLDASWVCSPVDVEWYEGWAAFREYMEQYQMDTHQVFRQRTSTSVERRNREIQTRARLTNGARLRSSSRTALGARCFSSPRVMTASKVALQQLPLVDVSPLVEAANNGRRKVSPETKTQILDAMRSACIETGFFTVPTEGVLPSRLIQAAYRRADEFIALPDAVKQKYHCKLSPNARGWTPMFEEPSYQPDVVSHLEGFDLARELPESFVKEGSSLGPNVWPAEVPGFHEDVYGLYEETTKLSTVLFKSFAEMLGLPADTFLQHVDEEAEAFMRLLTYPETNAHVKNSTVGIASHTDFECFTIIHQNGEGLHLLNRQGVWVEAPVCDDRLFVMVGDMLEHWTNGVLVATEHRVCNSEKKRQSIVRFNGANGDTVVEPLPAFVTSENPPRYARMTQREHITNQINLAEQLLQKTKAAAQV